MKIHGEVILFSIDYKIKAIIISSIYQTPFVPQVAWPIVGSQFKMTGSLMGKGLITGIGYGRGTGTMGSHTRRGMQLHVFSLQV